MAIKIYPYKQGSRSARALADALGGRVLRLQGSAYRPRVQDTVINWGSSSVPMPLSTGTRLLNTQASVVGASNKLSAFRVMQAAEVQIPQFWTRTEDIPDDAFPIVCRTILNGHSGRGIVIANNRGELVPAPLYVKYMKKRDEYRIHVGREGIIAIQRKAIPNGTNPADTRIRNHHNGYVFVRNNVEPPEQVVEQARLAIGALGLDFGAVDIIWNNHHQLATVLEVNTAPGLEGQTITDYTNYFRGLIG
jgi:glutathione synthase/RimK-type ligase-like ATP-grasp enzyme